MARILVVEDDKYLNKLLSDQLMLRGHDVVSVLDGEIAWKQLLVHEDFDILVIDMLLPRKMGAEVLSELRQLNRPNDPRIIAISGVYKNASETQEISALYQLADYLTKPFSLDDFIAAVEGEKKTGKQSFLMKGLLEDTPIEVLFLQAYRGAFTGSLTLKHQETQRRIYFSNGFPISADSNSVAESLGRSLLAMKVIDQKTLDEASTQMVAQRVQFGQMLIKMQALTPEQLFASIRKHTQRILLKSFMWREGHYHFESLESLPKHILHLEFNPLILALKAHRALYNTEFIQTLFETKMDAFCHYSPEIGQIISLLNLDEESFQFFNTLPGDQPFKKLVETIPSENRETLYRIFYLLETSRLLQWKDQAGQNQVDAVASTDFKDSFTTEATLSEETKTSLQAEYISLLNKDYFEIFNLSPEATEKEIDEAYRALRYRLHPDRFEDGLAGESQRIIDDMLARIDLAYQTLSKAEDREQYMATIERFREDSLADSKRFLDAQELFRDGLKSLHRGKFKDAKLIFLQAQLKWDRGFEYKLYALYCDFKATFLEAPEKSAPYLEALRTEVQNHRSSDIGFVLLGHAYTASEKPDLAKDAYQMALKNNENNEEALLALGKINEVKFKKAQVGGVVKQTRKHSRTISYALLVILALGAAHLVKSKLIDETGIETLEARDWHSIMPAVSARKKSQIVKIIVKDEWIESVPDPVLIGKCNELLQKLSIHATMTLMLSDSKTLRASCQKTSLRRYDR